MIDLSQRRSAVVRARIEDASIPEPMSGCWIWLNALCASGYAKMQVRPHASSRASRFSYAAFKGPVAADLFVRHRCDTPCCVNPDHLILGTPAENTGDMVRRGRNASGEAHHQAKLTAAEADSIRYSNEKLKVLAERFGVTISTVSAIRLGKIWAKQKDRAA